eukprot:4269530-Pyramimonas_sp.AAC.1
MALWSDRPSGVRHASRGSRPKDLLKLMKAGKQILLRATAVTSLTRVTTTRRHDASRLDEPDEGRVTTTHTNNTRDAPIGWQPH